MLVEADHVYLIPPKKEMIISGGRLLLSERDRAAGAHAADRRLLPLARAGLRAARGRRSCCPAAAATARAASATSTRPAASCSCRTSRARSSTACREPRATPGVARLRARAARRCRACSLEHAGARRTRRGRRAEPQPSSRDGPRRRLPHAARTSSGSTSRTTSRAPSRAASSGGSRSRASHDIDEYVAAAEARARRARRALPRSADRRDALLPRRGGVRRCSSSRSCPSCCSASRGTRRCASGSPAARPAKRRTRSPSSLHELMARLRRAAGQDLRDRRAPRLARARGARHLRRGGGRERLAGAARALLHPHAATATRSCPELRQMVVFAQHNVIKDAPFTRVDLDHAAATCSSTCSRRRSRRCSSLFHFALNRGGVLFLGPERERRARSPHDFETVDKHWRIYRKHSDVADAGRRARQPPTLAGAARSARRAARRRRPALAVAAARHLRRAARRGHAAEPARQRARRARPRVRRARAASCSCATAARASTCSSWSTPS